MEMLGKIKARGDNDFSVNDFDSMSYLLAFVKVCVGLICISIDENQQPTAQEILRVYPIVIEIVRAANKDDVLPFSKPVIGVSGNIYKELPVSAGTLIMISTVGYNLCVRPLDLRIHENRRD